MNRRSLIRGLLSFAGLAALPKKALGPVLGGIPSPIAAQEALRGPPSSFLIIEECETHGGGIGGGGEFISYRYWKECQVTFKREELLFPGGLKEVQAARQAILKAEILNFYGND